MTTSSGQDEPTPAVYWLNLLRDGSGDERQRARTELGCLLEARGLIAEAADAYRANVEAGVADRRPYERLAAIARLQADQTTEAWALRALADLLEPRPAETAESVESPPEAPDEPALPATRSSVNLADLAELATAPVGLPGTEPAADPVPVVATETPPPTVTVLADLAALAAAPVTDPDTEVVPAPRVEAEAVPAATVGGEIVDRPVAEPESTGDVDGAPDAERIPAPAPARERSRRLVQAQAASRPGLWNVAVTAGLALVAVLVVAVAAGFLPGPEFLAPLPAQTPVPAQTLLPAQTAPLASASPPSSSTPVASAPSPEAVELRLIADASTPPPTVALATAPSPAPVLLPARCADAALRFPETRDTETAVRAAFREYLARQGVSGDSASTRFGGLGDAYAARHAEVVAGWMAVILQRERRGLSTFSLTDYVASDVMVAVGPGEYRLRATISPQGWAEIQSWPVDTCEGAFVRDPANARWIERVQASIGDITWALPTPAGR